MLALECCAANFDHETHNSEWRVTVYVSLVLWSAGGAGASLWILRPCNLAFHLLRNLRFMDLARTGGILVTYGCRAYLGPCHIRCLGERCSRRCSRCSQVASSGQRFCQHCGQRLEAWPRAVDASRWCWLPTDAHMRYQPTQDTRESGAPWDTLCEAGNCYTMSTWWLLSCPHPKHLVLVIRELHAADLGSGRVLLAAWG